jgi:hypothetical protein
MFENWASAHRKKVKDSQTPKFGSWLATALAKSRSLSRVLREVMYGMTIHEMDLTLRKERGNVNHLFMLVVFGDLVGVPLLPPYYSMRLLPHVIPTIEKWKRRLLREKDLTDFVGEDI